MGFWQSLFGRVPPPADVDPDDEPWYNRDDDFNTYDEDDEARSGAGCCGNCRDEDIVEIFERLEAAMTEFDNLKATVADAVAKMNTATAALVAAAGAPKAAEVQELNDALRPAADALAATTPAP